MMRYVLIHGIETSGEHSVDRIGAILSRKGHHVEDVELIQTRWFNSRSKRIRNENLRRIRAVCQPGDNLIAHSNGCRLAYDLMDGGTKFGNVYLFAPALDSMVTFRRCCYDKITVWCNPHDKAILAAKYLPFHRWGAMGRTGYRGVSEDVQTLVRPSRKGIGHGHYFDGEFLTDALGEIMA